jgi:hypothetical protein
MPWRHTSPAALELNTHCLRHLAGWFAAGCSQCGRTRVSCILSYASSTRRRRTSSQTAVDVTPRLVTLFEELQGLTCVVASSQRSGLNKTLDLPCSEYLTHQTLAPSS